MNQEKSMKVWLINRENRGNKKVVAEVAHRKSFYEACQDKKVFGKVIPGAKPELMNDAEYEQFISQFAVQKLVM